MSTINSNSFGFLQTMNFGKGEAPAAFDREASAKLVLSHLASHDGPQEGASIGRSLGLTKDQAAEVLGYLAEVGMLEHLGGDQVALSSFGRDAMSVFAV